MFENFPYTNFHDLNTDWIIAYAKDLLNKYDHLKEMVTEGEAQLTAKYEELNNLLNQWYATHSAELERKIAAALSEIDTWSTAKRDEIIASIPEDYSALSNSVSGIENNLSASGLGFIPALSWQRATIYDDGHLVESTIRITSNPVRVDNTNVTGYRIYTDSGYDFAVHYYNANNVRIGAFPEGWQNTPLTIPPYLAGARYFRVIMRKHDDAEIDTRVSTYLHFSYVATLSGMAKNNNYNPFLVPAMRDGTVSSIYNVNGIATTNIIPVRGNNCFEFYCTRERETGHLYQIRYTLYNIEEGITGQPTADNRTLIDEIVNLEGNYCKISFPSNTKGFAFHLLETDSTRETFFPLRIGKNIQQGDLYGYLSNKGYSIADSSNLTRYVNLDVSAKRIANLQAFTIWNGKVYSVAPGTITEQDLNTMDVLRTASIEIGHGNNLQLASSGRRAYASGWDDNKLYSVSLDTLSVIQTFTLPVTGYTTCVVDDDNAVCYILQRNTLPDTDDMYALYRWDMVSNNATLVKNIGMFSALQAMDFFEGKIIFNHGLATEASPNMMRVINTAGDTILKTRLPFIPGEVEGVYIDRDNFNSITVSDTNRKLYKMY